MANLKSLNIDGDLILDEGTGTVSQVAGAAGPAAVFESAASGTSTESRIAICTIGSGGSDGTRVVMVYEDEGNSNRLTAVVGIASGDMAWSFGTPVPFGGTQTTGGRGLDICTGDTGTVNIVYSDNSNSNYGTVIVGTVSSTGTTITFGSPIVFESATTRQPRISYFNGNVRVIAYGDEGNFDAGTAVVATQSGTSFSFGTPVVMIPPWGPSFASRMDMAYSATPQGIVIVYADLGNSNYLTAIVGTISGTVITFGSPVVFYATNTQNKPFVMYVMYVGKIVVAWKNSSGAGRARVGTVTSSNQSISFGTEAGFTSNSIATDFAIAMEYDYANGEAGAGPVFIHHDTTQGKLVATPATISGTSLNFYTPVVGPTVNANKIVAIDDSFNEKIHCAYVDASNSNYGTAIIWRVYTAGGITVDLATGNYFEVDCQGATDIHSFTVNNVNATPGQISSFDLKITQGDNNPRRTRFRWDPLSALIKTTGGSPSSTNLYNLTTTNDAVDIFRFTTYDNGTSWYGKVVGRNFT